MYMYKVKIETDSKDTVYHTKSLEGTKKSGTRNLECSQDGINSQLANTPKKKKIQTDRYCTCISKESDYEAAVAANSHSAEHVKKNLIREYKNCLLI